MQVFLQTTLNPPMEIYDSEKPALPDAGFTSKLRRFLHPVVQVKQGDVALYKSDDFYPDTSGKYYIIAGLMVGLGIIGIMGIGRLTK